MADVIASDVPKGTEIKWYGGGVKVQIEKTVSSGEASAKGFALGGTYLMEYGSVWATVNDIQVKVTECKGSGSTDATEASGCDFVKFDTLTTADVVVVYGVDIGSTTIKHVATCKDVKDDSKASEKSESVQGQPTQITTVGTVKTTGSLEELMYTLDFVGLCFGDTLANSPNSGWKKWSNKTHGFKTIGALIGKRTDSAGVVIDKFFLIEVLFNSYGRSFPTEDMDKESLAFSCSYIQRARKD